MSLLFLANVLLKSKMALKRTKRSRLKASPLFVRKSKGLNLFQRSRDTTSLMSNTGWSGLFGVYLSLSSLALSAVIYLHSFNQFLESYALRYRILRMEYAVSKKSFAQLDSIFEIDRSGSQIKRLKGRVTNYESAVECQAEYLLHQQDLSAEQEKVQ